MKNSGITRRIDELGRIVIPKEIRRMLSIRDGENLEIIIEDDKIVLKKYNYIQNITILGTKLIDIYTSISSNNILITDREKVVACSCNKDLLNKKLDSYLINLIDERNNYIGSKELCFEEITLNASYIVVAILNEVDCIGLVVIFNETNNCSDEEVVVAKIISKILAEKLNIS